MDLARCEERQGLAGEKPGRHEVDDDLTLYASLFRFPPALPRNSAGLDIKISTCSNYHSPSLKLKPCGRCRTRRSPPLRCCCETFADDPPCRCRSVLRRKVCD